MYGDFKIWTIYGNHICGQNMAIYGQNMAILLNKYLKIHYLLYLMRYKTSVTLS